MILKCLTLLGLIFLYQKVEACKLYCEECPDVRALRPYYCCLENWQTAPVIKSCIPGGKEKSTTPRSATEWLCPVDIPIDTHFYHASASDYKPPTKCSCDTECPQDNPKAPSKCCYDAGMSYKVCKPAMEAPN